MYKANVRLTLKGEEELDYLGTLDLKERHGGEFPRLSLCLIYSRLLSREASNPETPLRTRKNIPQPSKKENFQKITILLWLNTTEKKLCDSPTSYSHQ